MRHLWILRTLTPTLLLGAVVCFGTALFKREDVLSSLGPMGWSGLLLGGISAVLGIIGVVTYHVSSIRLAATARKHAEATELKQLDAEDAPFAPLIAAMNDCMAMAEQSVEHAVDRAKELEIELKVATGQRQHAEAVIGSISDAVVVTDSFDEVLLTNSAAKDLFGFDESSERRPLADVVRDDEIVAMMTQMRASKTRNGRRSVEHQLEVGGEPRDYKVTLSAVTDEAGEPAGVVAVLQDMTREAELARQKSEFVSSVTHELRTPLASINAYIEMLIDGEAEDDEEREKFYNIIHGEGNRLATLIDEILNISRIESGVVKIDRKPISPVLVCKDALEVIKPTAGLKNITIRETLPPSIFQVFADRDMLYQATLNLLSNAVKYTPDGGEVRCDLSVDEATNTIKLSVRDTGYGIPEDALPKLFNKFYRVKQNEKVAKGTGLGLALVKHVIEKVHDGKVSVASKVGKGSCFTMELPALK
ncbi:MAG: ATP-binding protein [Planctomycetota bacterium]